MTRITSSDQVLRLLRSHLDRRARADAAKGVRASGAHRKPLERIPGLAASDGLNEADVARAFIAGLLAEEFGPEAANDPRFQEIVDDVRNLICADAATEALLKAALQQLTAP